MMKRNDGYVLSYVMIILLVLCAIAVAVTSVSLNNLKRQQASIDNMTNKYAVQGLVEQVVGQLENAEDAEDAEDVLKLYHVDDPSSNDFTTMPVICYENGKIERAYGDTTVEIQVYRIDAISSGFKITADFTLTFKEETTNVEGGTPTTVKYHEVTYLSYSTEVTS